MADDTSKTEKVENTATSGDHDRVQMLSLHADGTHDQTRPELIGDPDTALELTKQQFREQAVSAVDVHERGATTNDEYADAPQDPSIEALKSKHDAAAKAAEAAVKALQS